MNELFPNLEILRLYTNNYPNSFAIKMHLPNVRHFSLYDRYMHPRLEFERHDLEDMFKLNPHIETLELHLSHIKMGDSNDIIYSINEYLPNLCHLVLEGYKISYYIQAMSSYFYTIHFDQIESLSLRMDNVSLDKYFPFTFNKSKHLELIGREIDLHQSYLLNVIRNNQQLTSITLRYKRIFNIVHLFELEHIIKNIEDFIIHGVYQLPYESLHQFLEQNVSLQTFSIQGRPWAFIEFYNELVENYNGLKIRNKSLEFRIKNLNNQTSTKYTLNNIGWVFHSGTETFMELILLTKTHNLSLRITIISKRFLENTNVTIILILNIRIIRTEF